MVNISPPTSPKWTDRPTDMFIFFRICTGRTAENSWLMRLQLIHKHVASMGWRLEPGAT